VRDIIPTGVTETTNSLLSVQIDDLTMPGSGRFGAHILQKILNLVKAALCLSSCLHTVMKILQLARHVFSIQAEASRKVEWARSNSSVAKYFEQDKEFLFI